MDAINNQQVTAQNQTCKEFLSSWRDTILVNSSAVVAGAFKEVGGLVSGIYRKSPWPSLISAGVGIVDHGIFALVAWRNGCPVKRCCFSTSNSRRKF